MLPSTSTDQKQHCYEYGVSMSDLLIFGGADETAGLHTPPPLTHSRSHSAESTLTPVQEDNPPNLHLRNRSLDSMDAPTQKRHYHSPSVTSRKAYPSYVTQGRKRVCTGSDEEDELEGEPESPGPNATDQQRIEYKRRLNTLAARRSRKRKQLEFDTLKEDVSRLTRERDIWRERALMMERLLKGHKVPCPDFDR